MGEATVARRAKASPRHELNCTFCQAPVGPGAALEMPKSDGVRWRESAGCFCSTRCLNCVLALAALHPSPLASWEFREVRGVLTDRLLLLWRRGGGPDPALVLQAAERVASRRWDREPDGAARVSD
jgi:hypothetical protein